MQSFTLQSTIIQVITQKSYKSYNYESNDEFLSSKSKDTPDVLLFTTNIAKKKKKKGVRKIGCKDFVKRCLSCISKWLEKMVLGLIMT